MASDDDESAVACLRRGEIDAIDVLFRRHAGDLLRLARSLCTSRADAEDVVQDVFVGLPAALRNYEPRGAFGRWLRGVTVRTALAHRRAAARRRETDLVEWRGVTRAEEEIGLAMIDEAVGRLPPPLRAVFVLRVVEGHSHAEIAELLGIRPGTSEVRLFRAIRQLRSLLREDHS
jgi:RNA polymerase sigma-70 factor (ECF subfamily)